MPIQPHDGQSSADQTEIPDVQFPANAAGYQAAAIGRERQGDDSLLHVGGLQSRQFAVGVDIDQSHFVPGGDDRQHPSVAREGGRTPNVVTNRPRDTQPRLPVGNRPEPVLRARTGDEPYAVGTEIRRRLGRIREAEYESPALHV